MDLLQRSRRTAALIVLAGLVGLPAIVLPAAPAQATDPILHGTLLDTEHDPVTADGVVRVFRQEDGRVAAEVAVENDGTWAVDVPVGYYDIQGAVVGSGDPAPTQLDYTVVASGGEEGGPISHELVVVVPTLSGHVLDRHLVGVDAAAVDVSDHPTRVHSWGPDGYWAVDAATGEHQAWASAPGRVTSAATPMTAPTTGADIVLGTPTLTGTLLAPTGSTPAGHLLIQVRSVDGQYSLMGLTAADGSFEFDVPDDSYELRPFLDRPSPTEAAVPSEVVVVDGGEVVSVGGVPASEVEFRLTTPNVMVEVLTPELDPSPAGAVVGMDDGPEVAAPFYSLAGALLDNEFGLYLPDGDWSLTVQPPANEEGWALAQVIVTVSGGEVTAVNGAPASSVAIHYVAPNVHGRVLDRNGDPAPNVRVATWDDRWSAVTDVDGYFDIALNDTARMLTTLERIGLNLGVTSVDIVVTDGELVSPTPLVLQLPNPNVVATVTDPVTHDPVVGLESELRPYGWSYPGSTDVAGNLPFVISDGDWELHIGIYSETYYTVLTWSVVDGVITDLHQNGPAEVTLTPV